MTATDIHTTGVPALELKVGPKGYIHGWIFVGGPGVGDKVHHPVHGAGVVSALDAHHVTVKFANGHEASFEHRAGTTGGFVQRSEADAGKLGHLSAPAHLIANRLRVGNQGAGDVHRNRATNELEAAAGHMAAGRDAEAVTHLAAARDAMTQAHQLQSSGELRRRYAEAGLETGGIRDDGLRKVTADVAALHDRAAATHAGTLTPPHSGPDAHGYHHVRIIDPVGGTHQPAWYSTRSSDMRDNLVIAGHARGYDVAEGEAPDLSRMPKAARELHQQATTHGWDTVVHEAHMDVGSVDGSERHSLSVSAKPPGRGDFKGHEATSQSWLDGKRSNGDGPVRASMDKIATSSRPPTPEPEAVTRPVPPAPAPPKMQPPAQPGKLPWYMAGTETKPPEPERKPSPYAAEAADARQLATAVRGTPEDIPAHPHASVSDALESAAAHFDAGDADAARGDVRAAGVRMSSVKRQEGTDRFDTHLAGAKRLMEATGGMPGPSGGRPKAPEPTPKPDLASGGDVPMMLHRISQIREKLGTRSPADRKLDAAAASLHDELSKPGFDPATADMHSIGTKLAAIEDAATGRHSRGPMASTIGDLRDHIESMADSRGEPGAVARARPVAVEHLQPGDRFYPTADGDHLGPVRTLHAVRHLQPGDRGYDPARATIGVQSRETPHIQHTFSPGAEVPAHVPAGRAHPPAGHRMEGATGAADAARLAEHAQAARQLAADVRAIPATARGTSVEDYSLNEAAKSYDAAADHFDAGREYEGTRALQQAKRGLGSHFQSKRQEAYRAQENVRRREGTASEAAARATAATAQRRSDTATGIANRGEALADTAARAYKLRDTNGTELRAGDTIERLTGPKAGEHVKVTGLDLAPGMLMAPGHMRIVSREPAPDAGRDLSGHAEAAEHLASSAHFLTPAAGGTGHFTQDASAKLESAKAHLTAGRSAEGVSDLAVASALLNRHAGLVDDPNADRLAAAAASLHAAAAAHEGGEHGNLMAEAAPHSDKLPKAVPLAHATDAQLRDAIGKGKADEATATTEDAEYDRLRAKYPNGPQSLAGLRALEAGETTPQHANWEPLSPKNRGELGTPDETSARNLTAMLGKLREGGGITPAEDAHLSAARDAIKTGDYATATDHAAQAASSLHGRDATGSPAAKAADKVFSWSNERRGNTDRVEYWRSGNTGTYSRTLRDPKADAAKWDKEQRQADRVAARAKVEQDRQDAIRQRQIDRSPAVRNAASHEQYVRQQRERNRTGFGGSGGTDWEARTTLGRYGESRTFNGRRLSIQQTPNRVYTARIDGQYIGHHADRDKAKQMAEDRARGAHLGGTTPPKPRRPATPTEAALALSRDVSGTGHDQTTNYNTYSKVSDELTDAAMHFGAGRDVEGRRTAARAAYALGVRARDRATDARNAVDNSRRDYNPAAAAETAETARRDSEEATGLAARAHELTTAGAAPQGLAGSARQLATDIEASQRANVLRPWTDHLDAAAGHFDAGRNAQGIAALDEVRRKTADRAESAADDARKSTDWASRAPEGAAAEARRSADDDAARASEVAGYAARAAALHEQAKAGQPAYGETRHAMTTGPAGSQAWHTLHGADAQARLDQHAARNNLTVAEDQHPDLSGMPKQLRDLHGAASGNGWDVSLYRDTSADGSTVSHRLVAQNPDTKMTVKRSFTNGKVDAGQGTAAHALTTITGSPRRQYMGGGETPAPPPALETAHSKAQAQARTVFDRETAAGVNRAPALAIVSKGRSEDGGQVIHAVDQEGRDHQVSLSPDGKVTVTHDGQSLTAVGGKDPTAKARQLAGKLTGEWNPAPVSKPAKPPAPAPAKPTRLTKAQRLAQPVVSPEGRLVSDEDLVGHREAGVHLDNAARALAGGDNAAAGQHLAAAQLSVGSGGELGNRIGRQREQLIGKQPKLKPGEQRVTAEGAHQGVRWQAIESNNPGVLGTNRFYRLTDANGSVTDTNRGGPGPLGVVEHHVAGQDSARAKRMAELPGSTAARPYNQAEAAENLRKFTAAQRPAWGLDTAPNAPLGAAPDRYRHTAYYSHTGTVKAGPTGYEWEVHRHTDGTRLGSGTTTDLREATGNVMHPADFGMNPMAPRSENDHRADLIDRTADEISPRLSAVGTATRQAQAAEQLHAAAAALRTGDRTGAVGHLERASGATDGLKTRRGNPVQDEIDAHEGLITGNGHQALAGQLEAAAQRLDQAGAPKTAGNSMRAAGAALRAGDTKTALDHMRDAQSATYTRRTMLGDQATASGVVGRLREQTEAAHDVDGRAVRAAGQVTEAGMGNERPATPTRADLIDKTANDLQQGNQSALDFQAARQGLRDAATALRNGDQAGAVRHLQLVDAAGMKDANGLPAADAVNAHLWDVQGGGPSGIATDVDRVASQASDSGNPQVAEAAQHLTNAATSLRGGDTDRARSELTAAAKLAPGPDDPAGELRDGSDLGTRIQRHIAQLDTLTATRRVGGREVKQLAAQVTGATATHANVRRLLGAAADALDVGDSARARGSLDLARRWATGELGDDLRSVGGLRLDDGMEAWRPIERHLSRLPRLADNAAG